MVGEGEECDDGNTTPADGCSPQCDFEELNIEPGGPLGGARASCGHIVMYNESQGDGIYWIDPDGTGTMEPYRVYCDMTTDGGGWTLVTVHSDDSQTTWTWNNQTLWTTDTTPIGDLGTLSWDYKSPALHDVTFSDLLFVHAPSEVWASYHEVGDSSQTLAARLDTEVSTCWNPEDGYELSAGTLTTGETLCGDRLYFHAQDAYWTDDLQCDYGGATHDAFGPSWNASIGTADGCPFYQTADAGGLGPSVDGLTK